MDSLHNKKFAVGYVAFKPRVFITHCYLWVQTNARMSLFRNSSMWPKKEKKNTPKSSYRIQPFLWSERFSAKVIGKQLLSVNESFGQQCIEMTDERWDYFSFMRVCAASLLLLCNNVSLFSWSLNSSLNSLELYMPLLRSRPTGKPGFQVCELLLVLVLKVAKGS